MLRVLGLAVTAVLLLGITSCTSETQKNDGARTTSTAAATPAGTPTPTPTPAVPTTANVKAINSPLKWEDAASGSPVTTIKVGGKVTWTVSPGPPHSLQRVAPSAENGCDALDATFDSSLTPGQPVTRTFDKVGTFGYHCGVHKGTPNCKSPPGGPPGAMPGVIKVVP